ncbi:MAG: nucleotidyl transferase AbiEii/AbiGii toxin family protein [Paludibacteraceae bacterium]|nr:nucleotidyl transferase AbiEii/AbiGii toxin family protein [Paludibacteraceae bacterium]
MWRNGLCDNTLRVFDQVSRLNCIKDLYLCGGTGISLLLQHRQSEDLDFELLNYRGDIRQLDMSGISNELVSVFPDCKREVLGPQHIQFYVGDHVKLSFFAPKNRVPALHVGFSYNNLRTVDAQDALGMKLFTITVRSLYRDYYDIYSLLQAGLSFEEGLAYALKFTRHQVHSKAVLSALITPTLYPKPQNFDLMQPKYNVSPEEMADYFMGIIAARKK